MASSIDKTEDNDNPFSPPSEFGSLRDEFARAALISFGPLYPDNMTATMIEHYAEQAYRLADAMMAARQEKGDG